MADGRRDAWAAPELIAESEARLMGQDSPFALNAGDDTLTGPVPGTTGGGHLLRRVVPINYDSCSLGDSMTTIEACSSHGQHLMGAGRNVGAHAMAEGMAVVLRDPASGQEDEQRYDKRGSAGQGRADTAIVKSVRERATGAQGRAASDRAYGRMRGRDKDRAAEALGINQYADPEVGEGMAVYPAASERTLPGTFPMHFAPVVLKSGADYATLENYTRNPNAPEALASPDWYFKMFGPVKADEDQSFFGEKAAGYGGREGTMVLRHRAVPGYALPPTVREARRVDDLCGAFGQGRAPAREYPRFQERWLAFRRNLREMEGEVVTAWVEGRPPAPELIGALEVAMADVTDTAAARSLERGEEPVPEVDGEI